MNENNMDKNNMDERRLVFLNLINSVPLKNVAESFNKTELEIKASFDYIIQKIKNYCFIKDVPAICCNTIAQAKAIRHSIYPILDKVDLDKEPIYKITYRPYDGRTL